MNAETWQRACEIHSHLRLIDHEAAHTAAALLQGLEVKEVTAPFWTLDELEAAGEDCTDAAGRAVVSYPTTESGRRAMAIAILAGPLENGDAYWPPRWPLTLAPLTGDEKQVIDTVKALDLDEAGYAELVNEARDLVYSREYERLRGAISHLLEQHATLDEATLLKVKAIAEEKNMEHTVKAATVTATEQGEFTAIAAAYTVDRVNDQIVRGAFTNTIERWQASGKNVPVHWNHQGDAHNIIGYIDPHSMRETEEGLEVSGKLDLNDSDTAREAWRSMRNNAMSLSFGYVTTKSRKRNDGINELHEIDLFEVSIVPGPANPDTRVLSMKSIDTDDLAHVKAEWRGYMTTAMSAAPTETLRQKSERYAREFAPIQVAEFPC